MVDMIFCGVDIGTSSIKVMLVNEKGEVIFTESFRLPKSNFFFNGQGLQCHEQDPAEWWNSLTQLLKHATNALKKNKLSLEEISGLSIVGTSGTILIMDEKSDTPLTNAIMYNDCRAADEVQEINICSEDHCRRMGYIFSAPFAISKIVWFMRHRPKIVEHGKFIHGSDYLVGKLTDEYYTSDYSHSLKTGLDLINVKWPEFIEEDLHIPLSKLPKIVNTGDFIASTTRKIENLTGIPQGTPVFAGATDSTAGLIASGAIHKGDLFTALGSTIVSKIITDELLRDPKGRIYSHKFYGGSWILGGAGNCGTLTLNEEFGIKELDVLDKKVSDYIPTDTYVYPLPHKGERFPFNNPYAEGFEIGNFHNISHKYTAYLEGMCYIEKMMQEVFQELGAKCNESVYSVGGGTNSLAWMKLRATILNKLIKIPKIPEAAFGAALLVASSTFFNHDLKKACATLVQVGTSYHPNESLVAIYNENYQKFKAIIQDKLTNEWKKEQLI
ncbi:MAG: Pentulose/hexulose kinase [Promethearchaeota archaeon]|nr:MAG: Pentulose/hexulose kinase [Candidatus Lokiarchaeota archaeon]